MRGQGEEIISDRDGKCTEMRYCSTGREKSRRQVPPRAWTTSANRKAMAREKVATQVLGAALLGLLRVGNLSRLLCETKKHNLYGSEDLNQMTGQNMEK